ncbi:MAG: four helix bundle protein [Patescibacteria group bacterium]
MNTIKKFEDLIVWQKSRLLVTDCYFTFEFIKDFSFKDQLCRAAVSIMNNIAEGYERKGDKEFGRFLYIAKGSSGEFRSMLYAASDLKYITKDQFLNFCGRSEEISRLLVGLIKRMNT